MGNKTNVNVVALGGAMGVVFVWFIGDFKPVTPEVSAAIATIFAAALGYLVPAKQ